MATKRHRVRLVEHEAARSFVESGRDNLGLRLTGRDQGQLPSLLCRCGICCKRVDHGKMHKIALHIQTIDDAPISKRWDQKAGHARERLFANQRRGKEGACFC